MLLDVQTSDASTIALNFSLNRQQRFFSAASCLIVANLFSSAWLLAVVKTSPLDVGREKEQVRKDVGRNRYFTPPQAIEYGLIDRIVRPEDAVAIEEKNYELMLQKANAQQRGQQRAPAGASAEGGY